MTKLFNKMNEKDVQKLLKSLEASRMKFKQNSFLSASIKNDKIIGIIVKGYIQIIKTDYNGNRIIIDELEEEEVFGSFISFLKSNEYDILAKEDTEMIIIDYDQILNCNQNNKEYYHQFMKNLLTIMTDKISEKNERIEILTKKTIRNKLLEYFNIISRKQRSKYIYLPFNFTDLADYLAVDRSAMSRELKYLKEEGFIEIKGKKIKLLYDRDSSLYS